VDVVENVVLGTASCKKNAMVEGWKLVCESDEEEREGK
jgi:hypothetical protein